ncbi:MAG TPA: GDP-mannose 4,6-dehydratase [Longimicrobiales bacterium]
MPERILVTGAAGFIGSHLVERLLDRGDHVVGVDNFDPFYSPEEKRRNIAPAQANPRYSFLEVDCADDEALQAALGPEPIDAIVHLAAKAGVRPSIQQPAAYTQANIVATQTMLELARGRGIGRFVFGSSSSVYGNADRVPFREDDRADRPISPYAATKRACELLCHTYHHLFGTGIIALRFFTVYGPRQRPDLAIRKFGTLMLRGDTIPMFGDGGMERDFTWIDDILQGVLGALERTRQVPGEYRVINLGESRTTTVRRLIDLISQALRLEPRIQQLPPQPGDVQRTFADVSLARELLGYRPTTAIEDGIPRMMEWLKEQPL